MGVPTALGSRRPIAVRHLTGRVHVRGFADPNDLPDVYRGFDVVVVPSLSRPGWVEQFGRVAVEAMASGVPVVVSDSGALPEVVADAGVVVPEGSASALADALRHLAACPTQRAELRYRGLARAQHFSWQAVARRQADAYAGLCSGGTVRS